MSELSAEEKKRILRERRQAKMKAGNALERLNNILSQGSSVKASAVSVLDKPSTEETPLPIDDPEVLDINTLLAQENISPAGSVEPDFDDILAKVFASNPGGSSEGGDNDPFAQMMNMFAQGGGAPPEFPQDDFNARLKEYNVYQQKLWKFRFLLVRYSVVVFNFMYHYLTISDLSFQSSSYSYVRGLVSQTPTGSFITAFLTSELVILTAYYFIATKKHLFKTSGENNFIVKLLSMGSMVVPQLAQVQPVIVAALGYYELLGMFLGDLWLVVILFGVTSK